MFEVKSIMKLLDLYDHPSFKLSIKTEIVRQSLVDILKSFSFSCSTKSSKDAISKAANKIVTVNKSALDALLAVNLLVSNPVLPSNYPEVIENWRRVWSNLRENRDMTTTNKIHILNDNLEVKHPVSCFDNQFHIILKFKKSKSYLKLPNNSN